MVLSLIVTQGERTLALELGAGTQRLAYWGPDCFYKEWGRRRLTFENGSSVTFSSSPKSGYKSADEAARIYDEIERNLNG